MRDLDTHILEICSEAGLEVMAEVLGIVRDREEITNDRFRALTADDVQDLYESFVGPAVDRIEDSLANQQA